jgi:hypothetical protein
MITNISKNNGINLHVHISENEIVDADIILDNETANKVSKLNEDTSLWSDVMIVALLMRALEVEDVDNAL